MSNLQHLSSLARYAAQSKAATSPMATLGVDVAGVRVQVAPVGSRTGRARPPVAIRCTFVEVAVGTVVVAGTQELETGRPELLPNTAAQLETTRERTCEKDAITHPQQRRQLQGPFCCLVHTVR